jgi:hypothetical protein
MFQTFDDQRAPDEVRRRQRVAGIVTRSAAASGVPSTAAFVAIDGNLLGARLGEHDVRRGGSPRPHHRCG